MTKETEANNTGTPKQEKEEHFTKQMVQTNKLILLPVYFDNSIEHFPLDILTKVCK